MQSIRSKIKSLLRSSRSNDCGSSKNNSLIVAIGSLSAQAQLSNINAFEHLHQAEFRVYSQWGEDGILNYIFNVLDITKPKIFEIGAANFQECNSRFAAEFRNASVYAVDLHPELVQEVQNMDISWKNHIFPVQDRVTPDNIQFHEAEARRLMSGIDVVSLDIDGNDYWCLKEMNLEGVSVVVVEVNPLFGTDISVTIPRNDYFDRSTAHHSNLYFGMSYMAATNLLEDKGFKCVGSNLAGNNIFYITEPLLHKFDRVLKNGIPRIGVSQWNVRESRDENGVLNFLTGQERINEISNCEIFDLESGALMKLQVALGM